ncbi:MAG: Na+/H+ antiporter subunit G [Bacteroidales bacterium]|nr:Na+/H+ antiporter subunit G [Bacteroidales bacterium]MBN2757234.1 Na+/H+ antiporter subunit G [Bacteroidales bacterium]
MIVIEYLAYFLITLGAVFLFLGALGIFRMPDIYTRIQAGTKSSTLGAMSLVLGTGLLGFVSFTPGYPWLIKTIIIVIFVAIANPLSSHALARGAYKDKIAPFTKENIDAYQEVEKNIEEEMEDAK